MKNKLFSNKEKSSYLIISLIVGIILAIIIYYVSKELLLSLVIPFISYGCFNLITPILYKGEKKKKYKEMANDYIQFYKSFEMFSTLESDYLTGLYKSIEYLPLTTLKESLQEYIDGNKTLDEALILTSDRIETNLIDEVKRCLLDGHEYYSYNKRLHEKIIKYEEEMKYKKSSTDYIFIAGFLFIAYLSFIIISIYGNKF